MTRAALAALVLTFAVVACGGAPNTPDGSSVNSPGGPATPSPTLVKAALTVSIPRPQPGDRGTHYLSPRTRSLAIGLASVNGIGISNGSATTLDVAANAPGCQADAAAIVCRGSVDASPGNDVFAVTTYAGADGTGPVLSAGPVAATVTSSGGNVAMNAVSLTLEGIVASLRLVLSPPSAALGKTAQSTVALTAYDATGAAIVGASDYSAPVTLSIQGDAAHAFGLHAGTSSGSTLSIARPTPSIDLLYDGNRSATTIALQATVPGNDGASANAAFTIRGTQPPPVAGKIYALNAGANDGLGATVTIYDANATGDAAPLATLHLDPKFYAQSIALDAEQNLYVGYFDTPLGVNVGDGSPDGANRIDVYAPGATQPSATLRADSKSETTLYPLAISFDAAGELVTYGATSVDGNGGNAAMLIYPAGAAGGVSPAHAWDFASPFLHYPGPTGLALDTAGNFYSGGLLKTSLGPHAGVFVAAATDRDKSSAATARTLPWDAVTQLTPGQASAIGLDASGEIYVANFSSTGGAGCQALVDTYSAGASGGTTDVAPLRVVTIGGFATADPTCLGSGNFASEHFPGLAVFGASVYASDDYNDAVVSYPLESWGSVTPTQRIAGADTALDRPIALAIAPSPKPLSVRDTHARISSQDAPR